MIEITPNISIADSEIEERFIRSPGPGGQKVNKTASAVQLRFDARHSPALSNAQFLRLKTLAGRRMTADGIIVITARQFRTQELNRKDAVDRLIDLVRDAAEPPKHRRPTKTPKAEKRRRLESKKHQSAIKKGRGSVSRDE
jgi:ribosome-associated protein